MAEYKYFTQLDFDRCVPRCRIEQMSETFLRRLDEAREIADCPFILNSAYRSIDYEIKKGRRITSSHCKGLAVDISCVTPPYRWRIVSSLIAAGFTRIGIHDNFIHVDLDLDKDPAIWTY